MAFELRPGESLRKSTRRIARKLVDDGLEQLTEHKGSRDEAVHEARKTFKKIRAVLRLVRPAIGEASYHAENICFRDAGQPLTELRDAKILVETLDNLAEHFKAQVAGRSFDDARKALQSKLRAVRSKVLGDQDLFGTLAATVRQARKRIKEWTDVPDKWSAVGKGIEDAFRRTRNAFAKAAGDPTIEKLHEWRKQAKYLRYQLGVLRPIWPERIQELADEAHQLTSLLGDDHDLALLRQNVTDDADQLADADDAEMLLALIDRRRTELQQSSMELGGRFFEDTPREFSRRLKSYWKMWCASARNGQVASTST